MTTSPEINEIAAALAKAQGAMKPAVKDATNPHFRAKYADLASNVEAAREPMKANGLSVVQEARTARSESGDNWGVAVTTLLLHASGQWIEAGPLTVPLSKSDAHGVGSALTYARRYALGAVLGLVAEDDDGNAAVQTHDVQPQPARSITEQNFENALGMGREQAQRAATSRASGVRVMSAKVVKTGQSGKGPWTLHAVKFSDGREATTFSSTVYQIAFDAMENGHDVEVRISEKNGKLALDSIEPVFAVDGDEPPPLMDDDSIPF